MKFSKKKHTIPRVKKKKKAYEGEEAMDEMYSKNLMILHRHGNLTISNANKNQSVEALHMRLHLSSNTWQF